MSDLVGAMESLKLCHCLKMNCFTCFYRNLMQLGDAIIDVHMSSQENGFGPSETVENRWTDEDHVLNEIYF